MDSKVSEKKFGKELREFTLRLENETGLTKKQCFDIDYYLSVYVDYNSLSFTAYAEYHFLGYIFGLTDKLEKDKVLIISDYITDNLIIDILIDMILLKDPEQWTARDERILEVCLFEEAITVEALGKLALSLNYNIKNKIEENTYQLLKDKHLRHNFSEKEFDIVAFKYYPFLNKHGKLTSFGRYFFKKPLQEIYELACKHGPIKRYAELLNFFGEEDFEQNFERLKTYFLTIREDRELYEVIDALSKVDPYKYEDFIIELTKKLKDNSEYKFYTAYSLVEAYQQKHKELAIKLAMEILLHHSDDSIAFTSEMEGVYAKKYHIYSLQFRVIEWLIINYSVEAKPLVKQYKARNDSIMMDCLALIDELLGNDALDILIEKGFFYELLTPYCVRRTFELISKYDYSLYVDFLQKHFSKVKNSDIRGIVKKNLPQYKK